jgi:two-component system sensor histidine kinase BaeS
VRLPRLPGLLQGIAGRIAIAALLVAGVAVAVLGAGVLVVGASVFERLMVEHGQTAADARAMFDASVSMVFLATAWIAAVLAVVLALILARRLARPLEQIGRAARRVASGDYAARVPRGGPEEVSSLADSFNQMAESLEAQEELRREFIANAAHELRTPLTNLQGYLEGLREGVVPAESGTFESLAEEVDRLVRLSRGLDALAEGDTAAPPPVLVDLDLVEAVRSAVDMAMPAIERARLEIAVNTPARLRARVNPDQLAQVLGNLLQNAIRYSPQGGRIVVSAEARRGSIVVAVTNSGDRIPFADLPHIFERFYRVEKSRDRARGGAGIGLAIVKQLVEAVGGRVGADSTDGLTRVWFSLPR